MYLQTLENTNDNVNHEIYFSWNDQAVNNKEKIENINKKKEGQEEKEKEGKEKEGKEKEGKENIYDIQEESNEPKTKIRSPDEFIGAQDVIREIRSRYNSYYYEFQKFMYTNDIVVAAVGFTVGIVTKDMIMSVLNEIFIPIFTFLGHTKKIEKTKKYLLDNIPGLIIFFMSIGNIFWNVLVWFLTIILTFLILEYFFNRSLLGLKTRVPENRKKDFILARLDAQRNPIDEEDYLFYKDYINKNEEK